MLHSFRPNQRPFNLHVDLSYFRGFPPKYEFLASRPRMITHLGKKEEIPGKGFSFSFLKPLFYEAFGRQQQAPLQVSERHFAVGRFHA